MVLISRDLRYARVNGSIPLKTNFFLQNRAVRVVFIDPVSSRVVIFYSIRSFPPFFSERFPPTSTAVFR